MPELSTKFSIYLRGSGADFIATFIRKASGFGSVWLLNRILMKGAYGNYEFAFTIVSLLLLVGSGGLNHAVMYRLSRLDAPPEELGGYDFVGATLGWSLLASIFFAGGVFVGAPYIEMLAGNESLAFWVSLLSFLIPLGVVRNVYRSWFEARQRIPEAVLMGKVLPSVGKVGFLGGVWMVWPTPQGVVAAILLSELIPLLLWYLRTPTNPLNLWGQLSSWDVWYSLKLALTKGLSKTQKNADILMIGFLATAESTAEYVVAAKIALLLVIGHKILNTTLRPRIGRFLAQEDWSAVLEEYDQSRSAALLFSLFGAAALAVLGEQILGFFGGYEEAYPALMVLVASHVTSVSFGMCGGYLNIAGYAGWTLVTTVSLLFVNIILNYILIPIYGPIGAATATLVSYLSVNSLTAFLIYYQDGLKLYSLKILLVVVSSIVVIFSVATKSISCIHGFLMIMTFSFYILYTKRKKLMYNLNVNFRK